MNAYTYHLPLHKTYFHTMIYEIYFSQGLEEPSTICFLLFFFSFSWFLVFIWSLEKRGHWGSMNCHLRKHSDTRAVPADSVIKLWGHV